MRYALVLAAVALDLAAFGMAFTDIALRARAYSASPVLVGLILSSYFLFQIITAPKWGALSDRIGRRPVAIVCTALSAGSMMIYAVEPSLIGIAVSRVFAGLAAANVPVIQASLIDGASGDQRARIIGHFSAAINLGLIMGYSGGGWIAEHFGSRSLGWIGVGLSGCATLALCLGLPSAPIPRTGEPPSRGTLQLIRDLPNLRPLFILATISWFALATLEGTFAQLLWDRFHLGQAAFGLILMLEMLLGLALQGFFFARLIRRHGHQIVLRVGYGLQATGLIATPFVPSLGLLLVACSLYAIGKGLTDPSLNTLASEGTPEGRQGEMFGLLQSARNLGFLVGPSLGGVLFTWYLAAPYVLAGSVSLVAGLRANRIEAKPAKPS